MVIVKTAAPLYLFSDGEEEPLNSSIGFKIHNLHWSETAQTLKKNKLNTSWSKNPAALLTDVQHCPLRPKDIKAIDTSDPAAKCLIVDLLSQSTYRNVIKLCINAKNNYFNRKMKLTDAMSKTGFVSMSDLNLNQMSLI